MPSLSRSQSALIALLLGLCLITALVVFWPALTGPFLFDDFPNLEALGHHGGVTSLETLLLFLTSFDNFLGRPLSMLSFVMNDQYWPAAPWPFKYTNLLLHVLNGVLVFVLARRLAALMTTDAWQLHLTALAATALWLLHPMQLSTMMLVVQRMTELMALFVLLGLIFYLHGRLLAPRQPLRGYAWMSAGIGLCGILSVLSKDNGILLPLYALVLEGTLIRVAGIDRPTRWRAWSGVFLYLPLLLLCGYIVFSVGTFRDFYAIREFTPWERLLTEARILVDYLRLILLPRVGGTGLFHDDYVLSTGLLSPPATALALLFWGALLGLAWRYRTRHPVAAFAVLWFLAGHVLESTFLYLELYFEHRNYLPMIGPLFAISYYAFKLSGSLRRLSGAIVAGFLGLVIFLSWQSSYIWGSEALLANIWAAENPGSVRAQQMAANFWLQRGDMERGLSHIRTAIRHNPDHANLKLNALYTTCLQGTIQRAEIEQTRLAMDDGVYANDTFESLERLRDLVKADTCPELTYDDLDQIIHALLDNPRYGQVPRAKRNLLYIRGWIYAYQGILDQSIASMDAAYAADPGLDIALQQALWLRSAGLYDEALRYIEIARTTLMKRPLMQELHKTRIDTLEKLIEAQQQAHKITLSKN